MGATSSAVSRPACPAKISRKHRLSPKLGFLGFCGFLGFAGFWTYGALGDLSGFIFFAFFGFFGFFFEGKMSNTLMQQSPGMVGCLIVFHKKTPPNLL